MFLPLHRNQKNKQHLSPTASRSSRLLMMTVYFFDNGDSWMTDDESLFLPKYGVEFSFYELGVTSIANFLEVVRKGSKVVRTIR